jgi:ribonuclease VapC
MVIDTSALAAILFREADALRFRAAIEDSAETFISAATVLEASILFTHRSGVEGARWLDALLKTANIETVAFDGEQLLIARQAQLRFGKGRHPAALNYCDCFSYALAKSLGRPLLFKGIDFAQTDIATA